VVTRVRAYQSAPFLANGLSHAGVPVCLAQATLAAACRAFPLALDGVLALQIGVNEVIE
jgi:hypothetical protein